MSIGIRMGILILFSMMLYFVGVACSQELPEQFRIWGKAAVEHPYLIHPERISASPSEIPEYTTEEEDRGYILFARSPSAVIASKYRPTEVDRCGSLEVRDCPGQYGPITFSVFTLREAVFSIQVSAAKGPDASIIGVENFDIRALRYVQVEDESIPLLIESFDSIAVPERQVQQFWITYCIPDQTLAGVYEGEVTIFVDGKESLVVPLHITVNSFRLAEPKPDFYIYSNNGDTPEAFLSDLADQRCHGMTISMIDMPVTRDGDLSHEALAPWLDAYQKASFPKPYFHTMLANRVTCEWLNVPDKSIRMWGPWFRYYPFSEALDQKYADMVRMIQREARKRGLEPILAVADEAGSHPWTIEATQHYNALIKDEVPDIIRELTVGGGWATGQPEHELWKGLINIWSTNRWLPDRLAVVREADPHAEIQIYNMGGGGSQKGGIQASRLFYGFFAWKAKADGVAQWVYYHNSTPKHNYAWPAQDGSKSKVPTLRWEAVREGIKDYRYLATLEKLLVGKENPTAKEAQRFIDEISSQIELRHIDYDPVSGGRIPAHPAGKYEAWRTRIMELIETLNAEIH